MAGNVAVHTEETMGGNSSKSKGSKLVGKSLIGPGPTGSRKNQKTPDPEPETMGKASLLEFSSPTAATPL